jgi:hypothetical protein
MSAINFLPIEEKNKALAEEKQNILAKEKAEIKLSSPVLASKPTLSSVPPPATGPVSFFKKIFGKKITPPAADSASKIPVMASGSRPVETFDPKTNNVPTKININNNPVLAAPKPVTPVTPAPPLTAPNQNLSQPSPSLPPKENKEVTVTPMAKHFIVAPAAEDKPVPKTNGQLNQIKPSAKTDLNLNDKTKHELSINLISEEGLARELNPQARLAIFLSVTCGLILIFGVIFFSFDFKVKNTMTDVMALDGQNKLLQVKIKKQMEENQAVSNLQPKLIELGKIIDKHASVSKIFKYLEDNTNLGVYYTDLTTDVLNRTLKINAVALDYTAAAEQLLLLEKDTANIESVKMTALSKEKSKSSDPDKKEEVKETVSFGLEIKFNESFFNN